MQKKNELEAWNEIFLFNASFSLFFFFFFFVNQTRKFIDRETQFTLQFFYNVEIVTDDLSLVILFIN